MTTVNLVNPFRFGSAPAGPYRYWRLRVICTFSNTFGVGITELRLKRTASGPNLFTGGSVSGVATSGVSNTHTSWNDDDISTHTMGVAQTTGHNQIFQYSMPVSGDVSARYLEITGPPSGLETTAPSRFYIEASADDVNWNLHYVGREPAWTANEVRQFELSSTPIVLPSSGAGDAQPYWRVDVTATTASATQIAELTWKDSSGDEIEPYGSGAIQPVQASAAATGQQGSAVIDGTTRFWRNSNFGGLASIRFFFGRPVRPASLDFMGGTDVRTPTAWLIQSSPDGVTWTTKETITGQTGWAAGETRNYVIT